MKRERRIQIGQLGPLPMFEVGRSENPDARGPVELRVARIPTIAEVEIPDGFGGAEIWEQQFHYLTPEEARALGEALADGGKVAAT